MKMSVAICRQEPERRLRGDPNSRMMGTDLYGLHSYSRCGRAHSYNHIFGDHTACQIAYHIDCRTDC